MAKNVKKIIGYVVSGILAVVLCTLLAAFISVFVQVGKGQTPSVFGYRFYYVLTDSMTPTVQPGEVIISKKVTEKSVSNLKQGDVITYIAPSGALKGQPITHRIEKGIYFDEALQSYAVQTRGDKEGAPLDNPIALSAIEGKMVKKSALLTTVIGAVKGGATLALIISVPLGLLLICLIVRLVITLKTPAETPEDRDKKIEEIKKKAVEEYIKEKKEP